jgi:hypothetical protein
MEETKNTPFASLGYEPVGPVVQKLLARYLRTQRKNMRRFFEERGLYQFAERMSRIRKSNADMMTKNRRFQQVLNDYAKLTTVQAPGPVPGAPADIAGQAANT